ncbi:NAD(P)/FAD-dependent oxidoreductase [Cytobacillus firmus]|uniref:NAD(P)/FAD-dependent oxidoreductase n=1 Tax=Cytobacillus firmus TaxID=1399 RepID=UPI002030D9BB|nr:FAD-binding oxidoreductase [Cytobacillus firmus]URT71710.1 FAD-binding oxidoreductase [Cytobacillus firmus]
MKADVIVIGGGVIGSSITYHLARDGVKVKQLEKGSIANQGAASRASAGGIRLNNRDLRELPLAKASIKRWESLEDELEADLEYIPSGQVMLYDHRFSIEILWRQAEEDKKNGIPARILNQDELKELIPFLSSLYVKGIFYPSGGQANPLLTTIAFSSAARRLGAEIATGVEVFSIETQNGSVTGVKTSSGFMPCHTVINAAGVWAPELHAALGLTPLQMKPFCHQMSATYGAPKILPGPTISGKDTKISLKQTIDGRIRAGGGYSAKPGPNQYSGSFNKEGLDEQRRTVLSIIPAIEDYEIDFTYYGAEAHSIDEIPILGRIPEVSGYLIAAGFSGHGFTISPAVGQVISDMTQHKIPAIPIDGLSLERSFSNENISDGAIRHFPG